MYFAQIFFFSTCNYFYCSKYIFHLLLKNNVHSSAVWWHCCKQRLIWSRWLFYWILLYPIDFLSNYNSLNYSEKKVLKISNYKFGFVYFLSVLQVFALCVLKLSYQVHIHLGQIILLNNEFVIIPKFSLSLSFFLWTLLFLIFIPQLQLSYTFNKIYPFFHLFYI